MKNSYMYFMTFYAGLQAYDGLQNDKNALFWQSIPRFCPVGKISALPYELSVGAKSAILGEYWQKELLKTLVSVRRRMIPAPLIDFIF